MEMTNQTLIQNAFLKVGIENIRQYTEP